MATLLKQAYQTHPMRDALFFSDGGLDDTWLPNCAITESYYNEGSGPPRMVHPILESM